MTYMGMSRLQHFQNGADVTVDDRSLDNLELCVWPSHFQSSLGDSPEVAYSLKAVFRWNPTLKYEQLAHPISSVFVRICRAILVSHGPSYTIPDLSRT